MHHLDLGLFHNQIEYTRQLIKDQHGNSFVNEIDHRLATIPRFSGLKIFSNGIQSIAIYIFHCPILSSISSFAGIAKLTVSVTALIIIQIKSYILYIY